MTDTATKNIESGKWVTHKGMMPPESHGRHMCGVCGGNCPCDHFGREYPARFCPHCGDPKRLFERWVNYKRTCLNCAHYSSGDEYGSCDIMNEQIHVDYACGCRCFSRNEGDEYIEI